MDVRPWELMVFTPCCDVNDFVLSLLPELGTMGSKRGGVGVTRSSTSSTYRYQNLSAFSRAFKNSYGLSPDLWRKESR